MKNKIECNNCNFMNDFDELDSIQTYCVKCKKPLVIYEPSNTSEETTLWHHDFRPINILNKTKKCNINSDYDVFYNNHIDNSSNPCIICSSQNIQGIALNDGSFLCNICFENVSEIEYPQHYEDLKKVYEKEKNAWETARLLFIENFYYRKILLPTNIIIMIGNLSSIVLILFQIWSIYLLLCVILSVLGCSINYKLKRLEDLRLLDWDDNNPVPIYPVLRHFHDPKAILNDYDEKILFIFNHWPSYPPFWNYLKDVVKERDDYRCQVTGCPSRLTLHIHHIKSISNGGTHEPNNLMTLCAFHHAIAPDIGHERIWGNLDTRYFSLVNEHLRSNRIINGKHKVKTHIRRKELITIEQLNSIATYFGLVCRHCGSKDIDFVIKEKRMILISCYNCCEEWLGPRELSEETGPLIAEVLKPTKCLGKWQHDLDTLGVRKDSLWMNLKAKKNTSKSSKKRVSITLRCPICNSPMRLIRPRPGDKWLAFYGCVRYKTNGCKGAMPFQKNK